tara:strand:+ start:1637 stop:2446 length:810 start_codon:yes stop_codon:yes gene_type:complete
MNNLTIYCVTNKKSKLLEQLPFKLVGVGKEKFTPRYLNCSKKINIQSKEKYYSELTFHYWFWKNELPLLKNDAWVGFCQKRRFWIKEKKKIDSFYDLKKNIITRIPAQWNNYDSILCKPINVSNPKKMKMIKRGLRNILKDPSILFIKRKQTIKLHFDMHHGYGILDKAINCMNNKDREDFRKFVSETSIFNPHIMCISKKPILKKWFHDLFDWLFKCERVFGLKNLVGYDQQRLYAYFAERYLPFWFNKYSKVKESNWTFYDPLKKGF